MAALLLTAVHRAGVKAGIAPEREMEREMESEVSWMKERLMTREKKRGVQPRMEGGMGT